LPLNFETVAFYDKTVQRNLRSWH